MQNTSFTAADNEEVDVHRYLLTLARAWPYLTAAGIIGAAIGFLVWSRSPILYQSVAKVGIVQLSDTPTMSVAAVRTLMTSQTVCGPVVRDGGLDRPPYSLSASTLPSRLTIEEIPGTSLLWVRLQLPDPARANDALLNLCNRAVQASGDLYADENASRLKFLERQMVEASRRMNAAGERVIALLKRPDAAALGPDVLDMVGLRTTQSDLESALVALPKAKGSHDRAAAASHAAAYYAARLELAELQAAFEAARRLYTDLSYRYEQAQVATIAPAPVLRIVEAPVGPGEPVPRRRAGLAVPGAAAGLLVAAALVIAREAARR